MTIKTKTNSLIGTGLKYGIYGGILGGVAGGNLYVLSALPLYMGGWNWEMRGANPLIALIGCGALLALATVVGGLLGLLCGAMSGFIAALISLARDPSTISWSRLGAVLGGLMGVVTMVFILLLNNPLAGIGTREIVDFIHMILCGLVGGCIGGAVGGRKFGKLLLQSRVLESSLASS